MVSTTSRTTSISDFTTTAHYDNNATTAVNDTYNLSVAIYNHDLKHQLLFDFVILPLAAIFTIVIVVGLIVLLIRKRRLDRLRHHLMPLYSFDPAEEGEDWEAELLEEGTDHQPVRKGARSSDQPQLSFRSNL